MNRKVTGFSRRQVLKGTGMAAGLGLLGAAPWRTAGAQMDYPSRNIDVYVPTREGGGADRNLRAFTGVWKKYLGDVNFEGQYYPGAAGRVGYEKYMGLAKDDFHELLFGNMGPEVLNWVVESPSFDLDELTYFLRVDADPGCLFVARDSKFQTVDDIIAEGKKRTLNVGVSRLAHPASLGALAVARHTGASINLIPLSGGRNTRAGVATGEMDFGALPSGGIVAKRDTFKIVLVFASENPLPGQMDNAPMVNDHLGTDLPDLTAGARAFGVKTSAIEKHPERYELLQQTARKVFDDPDYKAAIENTGAPWELIHYGNPQDCKQYVESITEIGREYKELLTGKKT